MTTQIFPSAGVSSAHDRSDSDPSAVKQTHHAKQNKSDQRVEAACETCANTRNAAPGSDSLTPARSARAAPGRHQPAGNGECVQPWGAACVPPLFGQHCAHTGRFATAGRPAVVHSIASGRAAVGRRRAAAGRLGDTAVNSHQNLPVCCLWDRMLTRGGCRWEGRSEPRY